MALTEVMRPTLEQLLKADPEATNEQIAERAFELDEVQAVLLQLLAAEAAQVRRELHGA
ncbi:MAG: hypothetical protein ABR592_12525 [Nitriliruptorales bacterium]